MIIEGLDGAAAAVLKGLLVGVYPPICLYNKHITM